MNIVLTQGTLQRLLVEDWPIDTDLRVLPDTLTDSVGVWTDESSLFLYSTFDDNSDQLIVAPNLDLTAVPKEAYSAMWQRVSSMALLARERKLQIPRAWGQYRNKNKVAFAAVPHNFGAYRWNAEIHPEGTNDLVLWSLEIDKTTLLDGFAPPSGVWRDLRREWMRHRQLSQDELAPEAQSKIGLTSSIELDAATFGAVTGGASYDDWLTRLTKKQKEFVDSPSSPSVKLRGPAGSGKTLTLELKLLTELYRGRLNQASDRRYLFATHSWSVAEQVSEALQRLDTSGSLSEVDVFPLLTIAEVVAGATFAEFDILGEDSQSGKVQQLELIDEIVEDILTGDWLAFESRVSGWIKSAMQAAQGSPERNRLNWDLMIEFGTVLSATGILPGIAARERYRAIPRGPWMMPIHSDADRDFVLLVYTRLVATLRSQGKLTSDQVITDLLNYLETFAWNIRRRDEGYDQVFVDELHLFTEQERLALQYLTRDPDAYPTLFMALDPRQSPTELYTNVDSSQISRGSTARLDLELGRVNSVELTTVHRFSPQILALVQHINNSYPVMDLGEEWELDLSHVSTTSPSGPVPSLLMAEDVSTQRRDIDRLLLNNSGQRTAIIVTDPDDLYDYLGYLNLPPNVRMVVIDNRDAVENLRYAKRAVVLTAAEYVAGLQFDNVIVVIGEAGAAISSGRSSHRLRRQISSLYVAITRATRTVAISALVASGKAPDVIEGAVRAGVVRQS
ncbi:hypothetical protein MLP_33060 [Microlunatus phosphovorus NM-1]|uniref:UvrD-like helicase ATP-binding domain-containing protein n=1 Tax=Microlunatus phosphovorus (strain ATCC 700054 / DSM 10555 / JCM 9379 / NBRC 101784 / NCIMB 13414 / VKM Ac-1990 / NM-1) TaxID=1032480 RepID=F5XM63_MICPN|nr:hypothetical protein [Microlunatus phosphovorus]BAK36320.1 hypothetical protein MLP_33060 [Microlunatus phosphovorus NM-1]